jgi:4'-phosphopantetheinyl transferase
MHVYIIRKSDISEYQQVVLPPHYEDKPVRDETRMGYALLSRVLEKHYSHTNLIEKIRVTNEGKPVLLEESIHFNISHSKDFIACVVGSAVNGIDIEQNRTVSETLARHILHEDERDLFDESELLKIWVLKEAYSKYVGKGLSIGFSTISLQNIVKTPHTIFHDAEYVCAVFNQPTETPTTISYTLP